MMREKTELVEHLKDEQKRQNKKLRFYCTMVVIQKYLQTYLWKRFDNERAIVHRNMLEHESAVII